MKKNKGSLSPTFSSAGISSQDGGARELGGVQTQRPMPGFINRNNSIQVDNLMGSKSEGDALGSLKGRE